MKLLKPSLIGCILWTVYFFAVAVSGFFAVEASSWHRAAGLAIFLLTVAIGTIGEKLVVATVGYIDTEFVIGLLAGVALFIAVAVLTVKIRGPSPEKSKTSYVGSQLVPHPNNAPISDARYRWRRVA